MVFTDPPWNVAIGQDSNPRHRQRAGLKNDNLNSEDYKNFLAALARGFLAHCAGDVYCVLGTAEWPQLQAVMRETGFHWSATIIWVKDYFVLGRAKYHRRYEPIWYGWPKKGRSSFNDRRDLDDVWDIPRRADGLELDVWEYPRPVTSEEHPTMKPVDLVARAVRNSSKRGDIVLDPCLGAGSTLEACVRLERACYGIEIEPLFAAVVLERYYRLTGAEPQLVK